MTFHFSVLKEVVLFLLGFVIHIRFEHTCDWLTVFEGSL